MKVFKFVGIVFCLSRMCFATQIAIHDLNYASPEMNEHAQVLPIPTRINEIIYPTLGFPSLVLRGQTFSIILQLSKDQLKILKQVPISSLKFIIRLSPYFGREVNRPVPMGYEHYYKSYFDLVEHIPSGTDPFLPYIYFNQWAPRPMQFEVEADYSAFDFFQDHLILTARMPQNIPSYANRALDLEVVIMQGKNIVVHDIGRHCVGLLEKKEKYRFIHFTDLQITNLDLALQGYRFDHHPDLSTQEFALHQSIQEMNFLNPDFAILSGDVVEGGNTFYNSGQMGALFSGMDMIFEPMNKNSQYHIEKSSYWNEYQSTIQFFRHLKFPIFMAPGNHDGYAAYLRQNQSASLPEVRFSQALTGPETEPVLFDGKHFWQKMLGPRYFSFDFGVWHFVFLDTFDHYRYFRLSYSNFGANDGGWISQEQMKWLETDLKAAERSGKKIILVGHHDPRGGALGMFYGDEKYRFPRRALLRMGDELWYKFNNFKSNPLFSHQEWSSVSTEVDNNENQIDPHYDSAQELMRLIETYPVTHFFLGHVHADYYDVLNIGGRRVHFIHTTALSAQAYQARNLNSYEAHPGEGEAPKAHWGYRVFELDLNGNLGELYPMELGNIRLNIGHDEQYRRGEAGLFSKRRPWPIWLPFSSFLQKLESQKILSGVLMDADPLLCMHAVLDPSVAPWVTQMLSQSEWSKDLKSHFMEKMDHQFVNSENLVGTAENPNQIFLYNGNSFEVSGTLEFPLIKSLPSSLSMQRMTPQESDGLSLTPMGESTLSTQMIETAQGKWGSFDIALPQKGSFPVYVQIHL